MISLHIMHIYWDVASYECYHVIRWKGRVHDIGTAYRLAHYIWHDGVLMTSAQIYRFIAYMFLSHTVALWVLFSLIWDSSRRVMWTVWRAWAWEGVGERPILYTTVCASTLPLLSLYASWSSAKKLKTYLLRKCIPVTVSGLKIW